MELEDLSLCDAIFVIGANPASNHPRFIHKLKACRDRGGEVIVINPAKEPGLIKFALPKSMRSIITGGSDISSVYVQPKIGGDLALFKGIAKYLIENNCTVSSFIEQYTQGYDEFLADIKATPWEQIEKLSGVVQADIEVVALVYARAKNAVFSWGMGMTHHLNGVENIEYIANLALMRGMIGGPGRGLLPLRGHSNVQGIGTIGVKPVLPEYIFQGLQKELNVNFPEAPEGLDTLACLEHAAAGKMDAALILGGNLYQATPNSVWAKQALDNVGLKVYLTTTLNAGHVHTCDNSDALILPVMARDEEAQPTTQESMFNYVRLSDGGITRLAHVRSEVDILTSIAVKTLPPEQFDMSVFKSHQSIRETIANVVPGMEELADISVAKHEFHVRNRVMHTPEFKTDNGKGRFVVQPLSDNTNADYPFTLMSVRSEGQFNSIIYEEMDSYRGVDNRWTVLLNPDDMKAMALSAGDKVDVVSAQGMMKSVHAQPFDIPQGNVMAYYPEANVLIGLERDKRSYTPAFKSVAVKLVY